MLTFLCECRGPDAMLCECPGPDAMRVAVTTKELQDSQTLILNLTLALKPYICQLPQT